MVPGQFRGRLAALIDRAVRFVDTVAKLPDAEASCRRAASALYHATSAALLAAEGAELGKRGGDARRLLHRTLGARQRLGRLEGVANLNGSTIGYHADQGGNAGRRVARLPRERAIVAEAHNTVLRDTDPTAHAPLANRNGQPYQIEVEDKDGKVRVEAAWALWLIARNAADTFPVLVDGLKDMNPAVHDAAKKRLEEISPKDLWAVEQLVEFLDSKDRTLRFETVYALGRMGPEISKVKGFQRLSDGQIDPDVEFRKEVTRVIKKVAD